MPSYQDKNTKLFQEALVFSFCMVIPYVLVYLFYNFDQIEEAFKDTEMWYEFGLLFFKFFVFFYILNSLDLFKGIVIKIQDAMTQASSQILEKYTNYCIGGTEGSKPPAVMMRTTTTTPRSVSGKPQTPGPQKRTQQTNSIGRTIIQSPVIITPVPNPGQRQKRQQILQGSTQPSTQNPRKGQQQHTPKGSAQSSAEVIPQGSPQLLNIPNAPSDQITVSGQKPVTTKSPVAEVVPSAPTQGKVKPQVAVLGGV